MRTTYSNSPQLERLAVWLLKAVTVVVLILVPTLANAKESDRYGRIALHFGIYSPDIDKEFSGATPFKDTFGDSPLFRFELGAGANLYQSKWGILGITLHGAYIGKSADALQPGKTGGGTGTTGGTSTGTTTESKATDQTSFKSFPIYLGAFYSFDTLALSYGIPLVLNIDAGIVYTPWMITGTDGEVAKANGVSGQGGIWGWRASFGLAFHLNIFSESTAAMFDLSWGVNNTYLFAEFVIEQVNNFGSKKSLNLSDQFFQLGLVFDF